ncbi:cadherin-23-like [Saccostrea echinata]|uniref:cadherin-23-like n=1 Tax=Saccostrea echinata TaxID=191078 RepID=UPI002A82A013|nr:cadherin-23-like [Saccostrea echinata]
MKDTFRKTFASSIITGTKLFSITAQDRNGGTVTVRATGETSDIVTIKQTQSGTWGVFLKKNLDREVTQSLHLLRFIATSSEKDAPSSALEVTLFVNDVNDEPPKFSQPAYHIQVPEDHDLAVPINISISATDPDNGPGGSVSYDMKSAGQASALYGKIFIINPLNGQVTLNQHLDFERLTFYQYTLIAKDGGNPRLSSTADLLITILDVPDTPPIFIGLPYMVSIQEGIPMGSLITKVFALDGDLGIQNNISYSLEAGECASYVRIDAVSGGIYTHKPLDRDSGLFNRENGLCSITLKASEITDVPSNASQTTATLKLFVKDINDNPPVFEKSVYTGYVPEGLTDIDINIPDGVSLADADQGNNSIVDLTVSVNFGMGGRLFLVEASPSTVYSSGSVQLRLVNNFTVDYNTWTILHLYVKAEDRGVPKLSSSCQVTLYVNQTNRFYPQFVASAFSFSIPENTKYGTPVASVQANDMDTGNYGKIQYILSETDNSFSINSKTGVISVACNSSCLDRERQRVYYMSVEARDGGGKVSSAPVKITLMDVNDNSPMFLQPKYEFGITENSSLISGINNFTVHAVDYDEPRTANSLITYTLLPRLDTLDKHFTISSTTGSIRIVNPLTRNQLSSIPDGRLELAVTAHDHGSPSLASTVSVTAFLQAHLHSATSCNYKNSSSTTSVKPAQHGDTYSGQSFVLCEGQAGYIQCEVGKLIRIISAVYGRTTNDICPSSNLGSLRCQSHSSTDRAKWSCNGYRRCRLSADSSIFGEPCVGVDKYLEVSFHCVDRSDILGIFG